MSQDVSNSYYLKANIAVLNVSGNVGKTTVSRLLLKPRMDQDVTGDIVYIETINADKETLEGNKISAEQFRQLSEMLVGEESLIVDIGASNIEGLFKSMRQIVGSHEDFDFYVVPVTPDPKVRQNSISTLSLLTELGVDPENIKVVFNKVKLNDDLEYVFGDIIHVMNKLNIPVHTDAVIYYNDFFTEVVEKELTLDKLFEQDHKRVKQRVKVLGANKNRTPSEQKEFEDLRRLVTQQRMAVSATMNCDKVFEALFEDAIAEQAKDDNEDDEHVEATA